MYSEGLVGHSDDSFGKYPHGVKNYTLLYGLFWLLVGNDHVKYRESNNAQGCDWKGGKQFIRYSW